MPKEKVRKEKKPKKEKEDQHKIAKGEKERLDKLAKKEKERQAKLAKKVNTLFLSSGIPHDQRRSNFVSSGIGKVGRVSSMLWQYTTCTDERALARGTWYRRR